MKRLFVILGIALLIPASTSAASTPSTFSAARSIVTASSSPGNSYAAGVSIVMTAPIRGDFSAMGGNIVSASPVYGDELLLGGSISSRSIVAGDFRAIGGSVSIEKPVGGDLIVFGVSVNDSGRVKGDVFIMALNTTLSDGASGAVKIYGNNVSLGGEFSGNVNIVSSGKVSIAPDTKIKGRLSYESPEEAIIPASVIIDGGVDYENISYLPDTGTSHMLAFASVWFFLFVRILGALILAGLFSGLFPRLSGNIVEYVYNRRIKSILLTFLLGFALLVATPILTILLSLTFVGIGIAFLVFLAYVLLVFLSILYSGILIGGLFARRFLGRETVAWHDGVLGTLALSFIALIPIVGIAVVLLLATFSAGALLLIFFNFAFPHDEEIYEI